MPTLTKLFPVFAVRNLKEALDYYCGRLGFVESWTWGDPPTRAGVALGEYEIQLEAAGLGAPDGSSVVYFHMNDVEAYYKQCCERGATIAMELGNRPWGMKDFRTVDPSGNRLGFAEST